MLHVVLFVAAIEIAALYRTLGKEPLEAIRRVKGVYN
jgi:hypothetical protein